MEENPSGTTTCEFPAEKLSEDTRYYLKVVAQDGVDAGLTRESEMIDVFYSTANDAPPAPTLNFPSNAGVVDSLLPTLVLNNVVDPEGDAVTYRIEVATDMLFSQVVETLDQLPQGTSGGTTGGTLTVSLSEDTVYYWRARAVDSNGAEGPYSEVWSFRVNTTNQLPGAPTLTAPLDGSQVTSKKPQICWTNASDGDGDTLTYIVEIAPDQSFDDQASGYFKKQQIAADGSGTTCYTLEVVLEGNTTYYVRVRANDGTGDGAFSAAHSFTVATQNSPPTAPALVKPSDAQVLTSSKDADFEWSLATDPDGDELSYSLIILSGPEKSSVYKKVEGLKPSDTSASSMTHRFADELPAGTYYWYVVVSDGTVSVDSASVNKLIIDPSGTGGGTTGGSSKGGGCSIGSNGEAPSGALALLVLLLIALVVRRPRRSS